MKAEKEKSSSQQCNARQLMTWWSNLPGDDISILGNLADDVGDRSFFSFLHQNATHHRRYWICMKKCPIELYSLTHLGQIPQWPPVSEAGVYSHQALLTPSFAITGLDLHDLPFRIIHSIHLVVCGFELSPISPKFSTETSKVPP
ncbi:hypothetical protein PMG11_02002 [Penicillium brasilianum]|uniref:Uncharacterized protein n=1 Tax=Penicillium brasilianum TaxID=104259 RepID=A0A0F7TIN2_PENBI|nr:hypothetical protein PMG11_02002 [Penicillium brasilianum]